MPGGSCSSAGGGNDNLCGVRADELRKGRSRNFDGLPSLNQLRAGAASSASAREESAPGRNCALTTAWSVRRRLGAIDSGLRGAHRLLGGGQREIGVGGGRGDFEFGAFQVDSAWALAAFRGGDIRLPKAKIKWLPTDQPPDGAAPGGTELFVPRTGPEIEGITFCGSNIPKTLFRVARLTWAIASTRGR